jgi:predicted amidohydrolase YtcJ
MHPYFRTLKSVGLKSLFGSDKLKLGSVKLFQDGSIQIYTAALRQPYHDRPDQTGDLIYPQSELDGIVDEFHSQGMQLAIHCNGDAAISSVLESLEKAQRKNYRPDPRHLLIHCQMADEKHIERMKSLGAMPSYFINHVYYWGDDHVDRYLGPDRAAMISPLAATVQKDLPFTLHSDMPVTPVSPMFAIHCAVNRMTKSGQTLGPKQRIDVATAMKAYTTWGAMASFEEDIKGSIEPGKLADFVALTDDPFTVKSECLKDIEVSATYISGERVWGNV